MSKRIKHGQLGSSGQDSARKRDERQTETEDLYYRDYHDYDTLHNSTEDVYGSVSDLEPRHAYLLDDEHFQQSIGELSLTDENYYTAQQGYSTIEPDPSLPYAPQPSYSTGYTNEDNQEIPLRRTEKITSKGKHRGAEKDKHRGREKDKHRGKEKGQDRGKEKNDRKESNLPKHKQSEKVEHEVKGWQTSERRDKWAEKIGNKQVEKGKQREPSRRQEQPQLDTGQGYEFEDLESQSQAQYRSRYHESVPGAEDEDAAIDYDSYGLVEPDTQRYYASFYADRADTDARDQPDNFPYSAPGLTEDNLQHYSTHFTGESLNPYVDPLSQDPWSGGFAVAPQNMLSIPQERQDEEQEQVPGHNWPVNASVQISQEQLMGSGSTTYSSTLLMLRSFDGQWKQAAARTDLESQIGNCIAVDFLFRLGYSSKQIDHNDCIKYSTTWDEQLKTTYGSVRLRYRQSEARGHKTEEFQILDTLVGGGDVLVGIPPIQVWMTHVGGFVASRKKATKEEKEHQKRELERREKEAAKQRKKKEEREKKAEGSSK